MRTQIDQEFIAHLEELARKGQYPTLRHELKGLPAKDVPRSHAARLASLARRAGQLNYSARILLPLIRPEIKSEKPATPEEVLEYALTLQKLGAVREAIGILKEVSSASHPQALLYLAFCYFNLWQYEDSIPLLTSYLSSSKIPDYQRLVGQVNLVAALINTSQYLPALEILDELDANCEKGGHSVLKTNALELRAQIYIFKGRYSKAQATLQRALKNLDSTDSLAGLFVKKWLAVAESLETGRVSPDLYKIRDLAVEKRHWETVRDCEFYVAHIKKDKNLIKTVYFGTPFTAYKKKIHDLTGIEFPESFHKKFGHNIRYVVDPLMGEVTGAAETFPTGFNLHRLMILLLRDFYKPVGLVTLFSEVFPDEFYNPESSPNKVHQLIKRFRDWILSAGVPFTLHEVAGAYLLRPDDGVEIVYYRSPLPLNDRALELVKLQTILMKTPEFSAKRAREALGYSYSTMNRLIHWGLQNGRLEKVGEGGRLKYKFSA